MTATKIYTHSGDAHFDEICAIGLLRSTVERFTVERVRELPPEYREGVDYVVDMGGVYDPAKRRYDHHQDRALPAAFVLVARALGVESKLSLQGWYSSCSKLDTDLFGAMSDLGVPKSSVMPLLHGMNPMGKMVVSRFERDPNDPLVWEVMDEIVRESLAFGERILPKLEKARETTTLQEVDGVEVLDATALPIDGDMLCLVNRLADECEANVSVSPDNRDDGFTLFRHDGREGSERVDFSKLEGHPDVRFAHKGGFVAKALPRAGWRQLISIAMDIKGS